MSNTYRTDFDRLRLDPGFGEVLSALERRFTRFGIDYYLVGAVSRNAWLSGVHGIAPKRQTSDVDFGVFISKAGMYEKLIDHLTHAEGFLSTHENAFVLIWKDGTQIDLLPFGEIEDNERRVTVAGSGFTSMHVEGFREVYALGLPEIELEGGYRFKLATLPGIVLLKLIAWDDRPELRSDDITDIAEILDHFLRSTRRSSGSTIQIFFWRPLQSTTAGVGS
jgi:predicted nucleotidyltransferase